MPAPTSTPAERCSAAWRRAERHQGQAEGVENAAAGEHARRPEPVGERPAERLADAPGEVLDRHRERKDLAAPAMARRYGPGEQAEAAAQAEGQQRDQAAAHQDQGERARRRRRRRRRPAARPSWRSLLDRVGRRPGPAEEPPQPVEAAAEQAGDESARSWRARSTWPRTRCAIDRLDRRRLARTGRQLRSPPCRPALDDRDDLAPRQAHVFERPIVERPQLADRNVALPPLAPARQCRADTSQQHGHSVVFLMHSRLSSIGK